MSNQEILYGTAGSYGELYSPVRRLCGVIGIKEEEYKASVNGRLERWIEERFRRYIWNKIMLSDDKYMLMQRTAMDCTTEDGAKIIKDGLLELLNGNTTAVQLAINDFGYYAGYFDIETRLRVERLFGATHPIAGSVFDNLDTDEFLLEKADVWNRQFIAAELAEVELKMEAERKRVEEENKIREEARMKIEADLNHHSNKVRRRNKAKLENMLKRLKDGKTD